MPHYRIYCLGAHGLIAGGTDAECQDDDAAIAIAKLTAADGAGMEVWSGVRLVGQIPNPADLLDSGRRPPNLSEGRRRDQA
jgi:hypothetical protein